MADFKEILRDLKAKYFEGAKLLKDEPKNELQLRNCAQKIFIPMIETIENLIKNQANQENKKLTAMLGTVYISLGMIYIEIDEPFLAQQYLEQCVEIIEKFQEQPEFISLSMNLYNQLGILWFQREPKKAKTFCDKSLTFYEQHKNDLNPPISLDRLFEIDSHEKDDKKEWENFEEIYTCTLYYLAQICGNLEDALQSAVYCHMTLKRQLIYGKYQPIDWALNAATLAQFFADQKGFKQARHHLSASSYILNEYKKELDQIEIQDENYHSKIEEFNHRSADVARCWAQYGALLLSKSKERLLAQAEVECNFLPLTSDIANMEITNSGVSKDDLMNLFFPSLDLNHYENQVTDKLVLTLSDAKIIYLNAQDWIGKSQIYYTLNNLASDFIDITLTHCQIYEDLLFFEDKPDNQAKYYKRKLDLLENLLEKVNSQYYLPYCRRMWYEAGNTYINLLDIKIDKQRDTKEQPKPQSLSKINNIINKGLKHFNAFLESFENKPNQITESYYLSYSRSQFYVGVLYGKFITFDKKKKLENAESSFIGYQKVIDFCENFEEAKKLITVELNVAREMIELLPVKIKKLKSELPN